MIVLVLLISLCRALERAMESAFMSLTPHYVFSITSPSPSLQLTQFTFSLLMVYLAAILHEIGSWQICSHVGPT